MKQKIIIYSTIILVLAMFLFSGAKTNPPIEREVVWNSLEAKGIFERACADCHSNNTKWPWYSNIAPVSWFVIHHVDEGREEFNLSSIRIGEIKKAEKEISKGKMPLSNYLWLHPEAELTDNEKQILIEGLKDIQARYPSNSDDDDEHKEHDHD